MNQSSIKKVQTIGFYKENGTWYADLPEFLAAGLGTRANLMMVDGADTFLDQLSGNRERVTLRISPRAFDGYQFRLRKKNNGLNLPLLRLIGHAPVDYGAYYELEEMDSQPREHTLWLCPVTEYVFGNYPDQIHTSIVSSYQS